MTALIIREHNFTWDELHQAIMRAQAEKLIPTVREVIAGREFEYKRLGEYVIAMHKLCGGLPVVKYKDETGVVDDPGSIDHLESLIITTSLVIMPRQQASCFPSRDQAKV